MVHLKELLVVTARAIRRGGGQEDHRGDDAKGL